MRTRKPLIQIIIVVITFTSSMCVINKEKKQRKSGDDRAKTLWRKEYEEELTDAMLAPSRRRENLTRVVQSSMSDNEAVIEKFMDTFANNEKYFKKVDSLDFRLNRLDIEIHEKTNSIMKQLTEIMKSVNSENNCLDRLEPSVEFLKTEFTHLNEALRKTPMHRANAQDAATDLQANLDSRLAFLQNQIKSVQVGVDSIVSTISEVKNRQLAKPNSSGTSIRSEMGSMDAMALVAEFRKTIRDGKTRKCDCKSAARVDRSERYPTDCHEIQMQGFNVSGIYKIRPDDLDPFYVLCDLTTAGGGWTVFQNRFDGSQDFYKGWNDYEYGFGNLAGEFWLGLEKLNYLTNQKLYELRIEMETQHGQDAFASYSVFTVGPEHEGYRISTLGTFYGTAGDSLSYHAGQKFSTLDMDNDEWKDGSCASEHGGAWWYKECDKSNLNGKFSQPGEETPGQTIYWISFKGPSSPLSKTKMMIRPLPASKPIDYNEQNRVTYKQNLNPGRHLLHLPGNF